MLIWPNLIKSSLISTQNDKRFVLHLSFASYPKIYKVDCICLDSCKIHANRIILFRIIGSRIFSLCACIVLVTLSTVNRTHMHVHMQITLDGLLIHCPSIDNSQVLRSDPLAGICLAMRGILGVFRNLLKKFDYAGMSLDLVKG